ncbi:MAG: adenylate/guanylate cyclase domain-containing protein [Sneathiella sp.]
MRKGVPKLIRKPYQFLFGSIGQKVAWSILVLVLSIHYFNSPIVEGVRNRSFDIYQRLAPRAPDKVSPVVVIDIDEKSLSRVGQWPWPRDMLAEMVTRLTKMGAVVIGFDMVFPEADRLSPPLLAKSLRGIDQETRDKLSSLKSNDEVLASALKRSRVVLGGFVSNDAETVQTGTLERLPSINWIGKNPNRFVRSASQFVGNVDVIEEAASGYANFTLDSDFDGIIRRIPLLTRVKDKLIPILGLEVLRVATGQNVLVKASENGIEGIVVARTLIPTDGFGRMWIRYSKFDASKYVSAVDVLNGSLDPQKISGKLVLFGTSATGLKDLRSTPVNAIVPGVEVHAQMLHTVLAGDHLFRGDLMRAVEWLIILIAGIMLIAFMPLAGASTTFFILLSMTGMSVGAAAYLFVEKSILMDVTLFVGTSLLLYIVLVYSNFRSAEQQRSQIRSAFAHYLSPAMVSRLMESPDQLQLGGEVRTMSFLFCDIRGFTGISEQFNDDPKGLTKLINDFLTPMTDIILTHGGTIDKYMGDCIMAFWNAPLDDPEHQKNAVEAAKLMHIELNNVNEKTRLKAEAEGRKFIPINVGIGINSGQCVVGNMGSEQRFDYSVLGDAVNLAARLEGQCKAYGMETIIGPDTAAEVNQTTIMELDLIAVKGKSEAVRIYGCLEKEAESAEVDLRILKETNQLMLDAYRSRQWTVAADAARKCLGIAPHLTALYSLYLERIENYELNAPDAEWGGIYAATTK